MENFLLKLMHHLAVCRSCYMVFPSLQLALALSCVMGLVMFARYCGEDPHNSLLANSKKDTVSLLNERHKLWLIIYRIGLFKEPRDRLYHANIHCLLTVSFDRWSYSLSWTCCKDCLDFLDSLLLVYSVQLSGVQTFTPVIFLVFFFLIVALVQPCFIV